MKINGAELENVECSECGCGVTVVRMTVYFIDHRFSLEVKPCQNCVRMEAERMCREGEITAQGAGK